jgi:hypothetical protein
LDSHFLVNNSNLLVVAPLGEDRVANPAYDPWGGFGSSLTGAFADRSAVGSAWDFAYLVVPDNTTVNLDFSIAAPGFSSETVGGSIVVAAPEPGIFLLAAIAAIGLLAYARRH